MGVPKFFREFVSRHAVFLSRLPSFISSLSLDFNSMIHEAAQYVYAYGRHEDRKIETEDKEQLHLLFLKKITELIANLVDEVHPRQTLILAVDGVVPVAKQWQQRQRRYPSSSSSLFDSRLITPGTPLMAAIDKHLRQWLEENKHKLPPTVIYSSYKTAGEGEHIIMAHLREIHKDKKNEGLHHVIYGLDADLIILSMLSHVDKLLLYRTRSDEIVDISSFRATVKSMMHNSPRAIEDFALLTFFLGNDFLPSQPSMLMKNYALNAMISVYNDIRKKDDNFTLTKDEDVNLTNLKTYITTLSKEEPNLLQYVEDYCPFKPSTIKGDYGTIVNSHYALVFTPQNKDKMAKIDAVCFTEEERKKYTLLTSQEDGEDDSLIDQSIKAMVQDYINMVVWIFSYYMGRQVSPTTYYSHHYVPLLLDLKDFEMSEKSKEEKEENNILQQLLNVFNPQTLSTIFDDKTMENILYHPFPFPSEVKMQSNGLEEKEKHLWTVLLNPIYPKISKVISSYIVDSLDEELLKGMEEEEEKYFVRNMGEYDRKEGPRSNRRGGGDRGRGRGGGDRGRGRGRGGGDRGRGRGGGYRGRGRGGGYRGRGRGEQVI